MENPIGYIELFIRKVDENERKLRVGECNSPADSLTAISLPYTWYLIPIDDCRFFKLLILNY
jgi:hypothetical protein